MSTPVVTPPSRENIDWYRVKYKLASNLANQAYVSKGNFAAAAAEVDALLEVIWKMTAPGWGWSWSRRAPLRKFLRNSVEPAALSLKAITDLGVCGFEAGKGQGLDLRAVRVALQAGQAVSPQTIIDAVLMHKREHGSRLGFDFACFYLLSGDMKQAEKYGQEALGKVSSDERARLQARLAADPMLSTIPGLGSVEVSAKSCLERLRKKPKEPKRVARPWI